MKWAAYLIAFLFLAGVPAAAQTPQLIRVPDDFATITAALESAPAGSTLQIGAGTYNESITIQKAIHLMGIGEVIIVGGDDAPTIAIKNTRNVMLNGLMIEGGEYGILVTRSQGVTLRNNMITDSRLAGVKIRLASADVVNNTISNALPPYGRGIHVTNTTDWPVSNVIHNTISGNALEGIATNMARVIIRGNTVTGNGRMGIAVMEMTHAVVANNMVDSNNENGIYVSDMSFADVCHNHVSNSLPSITDASSARYGNGITIDYHSEVILQGNVVTDNANHDVSVITSSIVKSGDGELEGGSDESLMIDDTSYTDTAHLTDDTCRELSIIPGH